MNNSEIVLVTPDDQMIGVIDKITAHKYAMLHRAFSIFIYRIRDKKIEILLQQRQIDKYHCGGLWTNSCCSHPLPMENIIDGGERRLMDELGIKAALQEIGCFHYVAVLDNDFFENEIDHVLTGTFNDEYIPFNPKEVKAVKWVTITELTDWLEKQPGAFTPWFPKALNLFLRTCDKILS